MPATVKKAEHRMRLTFDIPESAVGRLLGDLDERYGRKTVSNLSYVRVRNGEDTDQARMTPKERNKAALATLDVKLREAKHGLLRKEAFAIFKDAGGSGQAFPHMIKHIAIVKGQRVITKEGNIG